MLLSVQKALQLAVEDVGVNRDVIAKPCLGRFDVEQLVDFDTERTERSPLAEQHHLVSLLGCVCGVRPSSLAEMRDRKGPFFNRGDIEITRSTGFAPMEIAVHSAGGQGALVRYVTRSAEVDLRMI